MVCPYCGREMAKGVLSGDGRRGAVWRADDLGYEPYKVIVAKWNLSKFKIEAAYCAACEKMMIDTGGRA